jgi:hypothetical protein
MVIEYVLSPYPALLENMVIKIYEAQNPTAEIYSEVVPERNISGVPTVGAGHQVQYPFVFNGADNVPHIVRLYSAVSVALLHEWNAQPKALTTTVYEPVRFKIGDGNPGTPIANTNTCTTPQLAGLTTSQFVIHRKNVGPLYPVTDFSYTVSTGEWVLQGGDLFSDGEEFTINILPIVTIAYVNDSVVGKDYGGFVDIASSRNYLTTDLRKQLRLANTAEYTFPVGASIPIGYPFRFTNYGTFSSPSPLTKVKFLNAPLKWGTTTKTEISLHLFNEASFVFDGTNWNVCYLSDKSLSSTPGAIIYAGSFTIGDVPGVDTEYTVTHNQNISGDYMILLSIRGTIPTKRQDNDVMLSYYDVQPNTFKIYVQEIFSGVQNIAITYVLIRL